MATLQDLCDVYCDLSWRIKFFGVTTPEALVNFSVLVKAAHDALLEEQGLDDPVKAAALPRDTVLGEKAQAALANLKALLQPASPAT